MAAVILQFIPVYGLQTFGFILFTCVLLWAYFLKAKYFKDPFGKSHAIHVIKTIWNFTSFFAIGFIIGGAIFYFNADQSAVYEYTDEIMETGAMTEQGMKEAMMKAIKDNMSLAIKVGIPTLLPSIIYLTFRIMTGYSNAGAERRM